MAHRGGGGAGGGGVSREGEMSVDETEETLTDPNNRIIKQITVEDAEAADELFNDLMGTGVVARKEFIKAHSEEATYNAE